MTNVTNLRGPAPLQPQSTPAHTAERAARPLDAGKIEALRQAIHAGRYPVDAGKLASKMVELGLSGGR